MHRKHCCGNWSGGNGSGKPGAMIGVGLMAAAAGAIATYYLYATKKGAEKRQEMKDFACDMKEKILEE